MATSLVVVVAWVDADTDDAVRTTVEALRPVTMPNTGAVAAFDARRAGNASLWADIRRVTHLFGNLPRTASAARRRKST